jgi:hypothetical protein
MRKKMSIGILVLLVCLIMMMPNGLASAGPPVWLNQATLSTNDNNTSQDPENSGFGVIQVAVWEEWNGNDWDIYMNYSLADGALGTWVFPPLHPATTANIDERKPAVTVTSVNQTTGATEIHVVYQEWNPVGGQWDVIHKWTNNFGAAWSLPWTMDTAAANDALDPAIVYSEDLANPALGPGWIVHITWAELIPLPGSGFYEIIYDGYYVDVVPVPPVRGYVGGTTVRTPPAGHCEVPEIAATDDILAGGVWDYDFAIVWQESTGAGQLNVMYDAGTTTIFPGPPVMLLTPGSFGQINPINNIGDCYNPDIAATQDYQLPLGWEIYYFHIIWMFKVWGPPPTYQIDTRYFAGLTPTPAAVAFIFTAPARGPINTVLNDTTIASKLIGLGPTVFETWMCWEDSAAGAGPDIWYRIGTYTVGAPPFAYTVPAARVPYLPPGGTSEYNPELWNRNDGARMFPPLTHLVFDTSIGLAGNQEVEYIDP